MRGTAYRLELGLGLIVFFTASVFAPSARAQSPSPNNQTIGQVTNSQGEHRSDRDITKLIRSSISEDSSLSSEARKIKVNAQNGRVTLNGTVESEEEKQAIESKAAAFAGPENITSELTVKPQS